METVITQETQKIDPLLALKRLSARFEVPGQDEPTYTVEFGRWNGAPHPQGWSCTCKDYQFRRAAIGAHCKHIRAVLELGDRAVVAAIIASEG